MNNCLEMASSGGTTNKTLGAAGMASIKLSLRATRSPNDLSATREWPKAPTMLSAESYGGTEQPTSSYCGADTLGQGCQSDPTNAQSSRSTASATELQDIVVETAVALVLQHKFRRSRFERAEGLTP